MKNQKIEAIINVVKSHKEIGSREIFELLKPSISNATLKRILSKLLQEDFITKAGQGKSTKYSISSNYEMIRPVDIDTYFSREIDERIVKEQYNFNLPKSLENLSLFSKSELTELNALQEKFKNNISQLSELAYKKELERLAIDLSWKSSQIEGNTYTLLETERLLKDKQTASGKTKEEAIMLLNHKEAIDFMIENPDYLNPLTISKIEDIHSILIKELGVDKNIRKNRVGISGTNYRPLDNSFQITEALRDFCELINHKNNIFEKALLVLLMISYIQPFEDGNKRTARIVSNAILMYHSFCPISFRTVDSIAYKKAMLIFYEQNNISCFKEIFIDQFKFAVNTYF